jgi:DNA-directed RNA polymerase subunit N (RpoN/RPB10)
MTRCWTFSCGAVMADLMLSMAGKRKAKKESCEVFDRSGF